MATDRKELIRNHLFENGLTPVQSLANSLGASLATVRRDLTEMEQDGSVERLHGSARIATKAQGEVAFAARENANLLAKRTIASTAATHIKPGSTIFLDAGTTVLQLARRIKLMKMPLTVFTNGIVVAQELAPVPEISVNLLGGRVRPENMSIIGPFANEMLGKIWFDQLFLGASAIDEEGLVSSYDPDEAQLNANMLTRTGNAFLLADQSKFDMRATYDVTRLSDTETLITDRPVEAAWAKSANVIVAT